MTNRRTFLKEAAACTGALAIAASTARAADWKKQVGLELYTVRDLTAKDYEGTVAKVAEIGYKEVEAATDYANLEPKQFRAMLDRYGLTMPSTHVGATAGPDLEKQLEGFQIMGIHYTEIRGGGGRGAARGPVAPPAAPSAGGVAAGIAAGLAARGPRPGGSAQTEESVKLTAGQLNQNGKLVKKFGMKILVHNHTMEFQALEGSRLRPYDILLAETDPALVAMQLDIGWASVAGQDILEMFKTHPGRFELWHVKDAKGIKVMNAQMTQQERQRSAMLVPVGLGEVDYTPIFAAAGLAGMKHYCIEQDNAADWGDSVAAARKSYQNLVKMLG
jgi:sugar phosphate isomerase/epimerase